VTAAVRREQAAATALVTVVVWQTDPTGQQSGRINEKTADFEGVFDANGFAKIDALVTFD
jgi:hypothetical protein